MKSKKTVFIMALGIICLAVMVNLLKIDLWDQNEALLKEKVLSMRDSVESINLMELTPFEWDVVYSFHPYTPKEDIFKTVGYKWDAISETVNEGMNQLVFIKDGKVVCYVFGYPENNGYGISFEGQNFKAGTMLTAKDKLLFQVERNNQLVFVKNK